MMLKNDDGIWVDSQPELKLMGISFFAQLYLDEGGYEKYMIYFLY